MQKMPLKKGKSKGARYHITDVVTLENTDVVIWENTYKNKGLVYENMQKCKPIEIQLSESDTPDEVANKLEEKLRESRKCLY
jgi:hypothetical protein